MQTIEKTSLEDLMSKSFGEYSKSIIQDRAIPDARDGLKPVQRRIICAMNEDVNTFDKAYKKSISGVANTMKRYHPHGDASIYEAMIRMGQWWKNNLKLVDVQGNEGSIDGDGPAASRYVEARLDKNANYLTDDLKYDTVFKVPNFDDTVLEPTVLPSQIPLLLINGSTGIAAGYATDIPPFNFNEVINACIYRLSHKTMPISKLLEFIPAPDFPTGGYIIGSCEKIFQTGKGKIVNSCSYKIDKTKKCNQMVIYEIPFDTPKADIVKEAMSIEKDFILDVRDESDKDGIRVVIDIDKNVDINTAVNFVLKNTNFSKNYNFNMVAIVDKKPKQCSVLDMIDAWCNFRKETVYKKYQCLLKQYLERKEIVEGLIYAYSILDDVIKTIKSSKDKNDVIKNLKMKFNFTDKQAISIAEMRLYRLCNTDIMSLKNELKDLEKKITEANRVLSNEKEVIKVIIKELEKINSENIVPRKTKIYHKEMEDLDESKLVKKESYFVVVTSDGYLKKVSLKRKDDEEFIKADDKIIFSGEMDSLENLVCYTDLGGYLKIQIHKVPECKPSELGTHMSKWVKCEGHKIIATGEGHMMAYTEDGMIKVFDSNFEEPSKLIKIPLYFKTKDCRVLSVEKVNKTHVLTLTDSNINLYPIEEITETSLSSTGLVACKIKEGDSLLAIKQVNPGEVLKYKKKNIDTGKLSFTHRGYVGQKW